MRQLLSPRWLIAHVVVSAICVTCIVLGFWQLDRLEERRTANAITAARYAEEPLPIDEMVASAGGDLDSLELRQATATGTFLPSEEVLVRSQVFQGRAGFDVITPLVLDDGLAVLVNRGWVPLEFDTVPVEAAPPPEGTVTVEGIVRPSEQRGSLGRDDSGAGQVTTVSRIDIDLLDAQMEGGLLPVYLEIVGEPVPTELPVVAPPPEFNDDGPHLNYAIQWFSFALVGAVGYGFLLRRAVRRDSAGGGEVIDDLDAGKRRQIGPP